jgi:electron transport complex protein RnfA
MSLAGIVVTFALVDNVVLARLLGMEPPIRGSIRPALLLGAAVGLLTGPGSLAAWVVDAVVLDPLGVGFLRTPVYVFVVAGLAWLLSAGAGALKPRLRFLSSLSFPEAALNSAALGVVLIVRRASLTALEGLLAGLAAGIGYAIVMALLAAIRARLDVEQVPRAMRGLPLHLVSAGLLALAFLAFDRAFLARLVGG